MKIKGLENIVATENDKVISFTKVKLPYGWLGNMSPYPIKHNNKVWKTSEALFQALRFDDHKIQEEIRLEKSPMGAKFVAKKYANKIFTTPMSEQDLKNMFFCLSLKLEQHPILKTALFETKDAIIIENISNRDLNERNLFWGAVLMRWKMEG